jgi:mannosyl-3-phosphoglycerate phosphatase
MRGRSLIVFTDLDGTLLDPETYSWKPAHSALRELARRRIPVIFCTSKTRAEVEVLRRKLGIRHPFITENGGGLFIPRGYFKRPAKGASPAGSYDCLALARGYTNVAAALAEAASEAGITVTGFHDMSAREVACLTGLAPRDAQRAKRRDFDVPFITGAVSTLRRKRFISLAQRRGLTLVRGSRFWHAHRGSDKGRAVRLLLAMFRKDGQAGVRSVGLGDASNDLPMLAEVNIAVLLPGPGGNFDRAILRKIPNVLRGRAPGPRGWNLAILKILQAERPHNTERKRAKRLKRCSG